MYRLQELFHCGDYPRRVSDAIVAEFATVAEFPKERWRIRRLVGDAESVTRRCRSATQSQWRRVSDAESVTQIGDADRQSQWRRSVTQSQWRISATQSQWRRSTTQNQWRRVSDADRRRRSATQIGDADRRRGDVWRLSTTCQWRRVSDASATISDSPATIIDVFRRIQIFPFLEG